MENNNNTDINIECDEQIVLESLFEPGEICVKCNTYIYILQSDQDQRIIDYFCECNMKNFIQEYRRFSIKDGFVMILDEDEYDDYCNKKDEQIFTFR